MKKGYGPFSRGTVMDHFFDEAARILASQMPRRRAFKLVGSALVGGIVAALGMKRAVAANCGSATCTGTQVCCPGTTSPFCAAAGSVCCGNKACASGLACCNGTCCRAGQGCVGGRCNVSAA